MNEKRKRILAIIVAAVLFAGAAVFAALAIYGGVTSKPTGDHEEIYLVVKDNRGNEFSMENGETKKLEYEIDYDVDELTFSTKAYHKSGEECNLHTFNTFDRHKISLSKVATYSMVQLYSQFEFTFKLEVEVKDWVIPEVDTRPLPEIEIDPEMPNPYELVRYQLNKKYVYKYNGYIKYPNMIKISNPDTHELITMYHLYDYIQKVTVINGNVNRHLVDIGTYSVDIEICDGWFGEPHAPYQKIRIENIIIQIEE